MLHLGANYYQFIVLLSTFYEINAPPPCICKRSFKKLPKNKVIIMRNPWSTSKEPLRYPYNTIENKDSLTVKERLKIL